MMFVYFLLFAAVTAETRLGIDYWLPLTNFGEAWSVGIFVAAVTCLILASYRGRRKSPAEEKTEPRLRDKPAQLPSMPARFQAVSPYDGRIIVGGGAVAAIVELPGMVGLQGDSGGGDGH